MKIGIYTAYGPNTVLRREGLGRYLGNLISGFLKTGNEVTVACPKWSIDTFNDLFREFQIDPLKVSFIVADRSPVLWNLYDRRIRRRRQKKGIRYKILQSWADLAAFLLSELVSITSLFVFVAAGLAMLALAIILLPLALAAFLLYFMVLLLQKLTKKGKSVGKTLAYRMMGIAEQFSTKGIKVRNLLIKSLNQAISRDLVNKINRSEEKDVWFVPALFWPEIVEIKATKVVCAPDLVTAELPLMFADVSSVSVSTNACASVLRKEKYFITYCEYLKETLVVKDFGHKRSHVRAIPHINNEMQHYITFVGNYNQQFNSDKDFTTAFSRGILQVIRWKCVSAPPGYTGWFDFQDTRYIFYPSQIRPNKNLITLIKAYQYLLRNKFVNVKLLLTGDLSLASSGQIMEYVKAHRLEYDVLSFPNLSAQELAAMYRCALLVVNPSLYEGGFPFTFGEGMSVGTPSLMSDIPQVRDVVEPFGLTKDMLFDPYDWKALADKIADALVRREELYQKELPLYQTLEKRTSDVVAEEYVEAFEYFIELEEEEREKEAAS